MTDLLNTSAGTGSSGEERAVSTTDPSGDSYAAKRYEQFRWYSGTVFVLLFASAFIDQGMQSDISNATWATGRYAKQPLARNRRTAAAGQLMIWGDAAVHARELDRIKLLHRDVKGIGREGEHYSAFNPEAWNLVYLSMFFMYRNSYTPITGDKLTDDDDEIFYKYFWDKMSGLSLPGKSTRFPSTYVEAVEYYDRIVREKLGETYMLQVGRELFANPPAPDDLPSALRPLWWPVSKIGGRIAITCGLAISRPEVREIFGFPFSTSRKLEFAVIRKILPIAYRRLPKRLIYTPLAYNRWQYERLVSDLQEMQLDSFKPDPNLTPQ